MIKHVVFVFFVMVTMISSANEEKSYLDQAKQVSENVWIGSQPDVKDFNEFAAEEVTVVINTRTQAEMDQLSFNEAESLKSIGITYELVEIGKGHAYSPAKLEKFNVLMQANQGKKVVLHCRSGHRASQLYAAWLIKYQGKSDIEALKAIQSDETELTDSIKALLDQ